MVNIIAFFVHYKVKYFIKIDCKASKPTFQRFGQNSQNLLKSVIDDFGKPLYEKKVKTPLAIYLCNNFLYIKTVLNPICYKIKDEASLFVHFSSTLRSGKKFAS